MKALLSSLVIALALSVNAYAYQIADSRYDGEYNRINLNEMQTAFNSVSAKESGGVDVGMVVVWNRAENPLNWEKWMECNGATTSEEKAKLLNSDMCKDYGICTVPDYRGMFLRGHGSQNSYHYNAITHTSGALGVLQGDSLREVWGRINSYSDPGGSELSEGVFYGYNHYDWGTANAGGAGGNGAWDSVAVFQMSRSTPVSNEIRPVNMAVRYLIRVNE